MSQFPVAGGTGVNQRLARLFACLEDGLHERGEALRLSLLAAIAGESVFLLGPPGVAKSLLARRLQHAFAQARCFDYLMGRFSTPEELFGPVSIKRLKDDDLYVRRTEHYLPEADIVFLDEIWKAGPPIQNALLTALNEKIFRNGNEEVQLPLKLLMAASNETASDDAALAFWDRFLIRLELQPLQDDVAFAAMIADSRDPYRDTVGADLKIAAEDWAAWQATAAATALDAEAVALLVALRRRFAELHAAGQGPYVSDRRWKKLAGLVRAAAFCHGRTEAGVADCFVLEHGLWNERGDRAMVAAELRKAVEAHAGSSERGLESLRLQLEGIRAEFAAETRVEYDENVSEPELADGEYYRLAGLPEGMAAGLSGEELEARIWKLDFESLATAGEAPRPCELFVYRQGQYEGTVTRPCRRAAGWTIEVGGRAIALICRESHRTLRRHRLPDAAAWARWEERLAGFQDDCRREAARLGERMANMRTVAELHFFLPTDAAEPLGAGLRRLLVALSELEVEANGCLESQGDC